MSLTFFKILQLWKCLEGPNLSLRRLKKIQERKLKRLLSFVSQNHTFYKKFFSESGVLHRSIKKATDLAHLPMAGRSMFLTGSANAFFSIPSDPNRLVVLDTSGTSGSKISVFLSQKEFAQRSVSLNRIFFANGYTFFSKRLNLFHKRHYEINRKNIIEKIGFCNNVSVHTDPFGWLREYRSYRPVILHGYVSALRMLAKEIIEHGARGVYPRAIFATGEYVSVEVRNYLRDTFQAEVFSHYSSQEVGLIAWECRSHEGLHVDADNVIVEIVRPDGSPCPPREEGEVLVTSLNSFVMPFIRYRQGDRASFINKNCSCGSSFPLLDIKSGREPVFDVFLRDGRRVSAWHVKYLFEKLEEIQQYKIIQTKENEILIQAVASEGCPEFLIVNKIFALCASLFGPAVNIRVDLVKGIPMDETGKDRLIVPLETKGANV